MALRDTAASILLLMTRRTADSQERVWGIAIQIPYHRLLRYLDCMMNHHRHIRDMTLNQSVNTTRVDHVERGSISDVPVA